MAQSVIGRTTINGATTVGGFNPLTLFSAGEQGAWYDPSDLATLYQDSAGTIPVTAVEQPVGRILDKSGRGNHATQATAGSRPTLSARVNLLTYSEDMRTTSEAGVTRPWETATSDTVTINATTDPFGGNNGCLITQATSINRYNKVSSIANVTYVASGYVKKSTQSAVDFYLYNTNGATMIAQVRYNFDTGVVTQVVGSGGTVTPVGNGWFRVTVTGTPSNTGPVSVGFYNTTSVYAFGADLRVSNVGVNLPPYQRVIDASTYDVNGFPLYLKFDGVDDWLATGSINFSSTNMTTAWAGVRKLAAAGSFGVVFETSISAANNSGSFNITAPGALASSTENYSFTVRGNSAFAGYDAVTFTAPTTNVASSAYDLSVSTLAQQVKPRVNGVIPTLNAGSNTNAGPTNFGNYPLYIGARAGTIYYFNGNLYGLIVRGASSTANQITATENWLNAKTRAF